MSEAKEWLYSWCGKQKLVPNYDIRSSGPKHRPRFLCEVRVEGFPYTGIGNSTNKKDSQLNAAKDFIAFLVRQGHVQSEEVPVIKAAMGSDGGPSSGFGEGSFPQLGGAAQPMAPVPGIKEEGNVYLPYQRQETERPFTYMDRVRERKALEEAEDVDLTANIHGNWTIENAKAKLNNFFSLQKIKADYKYSPVGPDNNLSFVAEMGFYVKQLGRNIYSRESGSNKKAASNSCALSLVRQLYHLNVIEAYTGTLKKKDSESVPTQNVALHPMLESKLDELLQEANLQPVLVQQGCQGPVSLINEVKLEAFEAAPKSSMGSVVSWSPPQPNWNPWISCNIDEGPLANISLDNLSVQLQESHQMRLQTDAVLQASVKDRQQLPVFNKKHEILSAISDHPVTIIRGNTGCGKTTQVCQFILDDYIQSGSGAYCNVVITQPRRISAISVADRVACERCEELGQSVGYSVRFESVLPRPYGGILFCTVGVLLRKLEAGLRGVSHVIVDEIHERDLNSDFILIVLRDMVRAFPDLRIILMSATIDISLFSDYFGNPYVIEVEGRAYPVDAYFLEDFIDMTGFTPTPESKKSKGKNKDKDEDEAQFEEPEENMNFAPGTYKSQTHHAMSLLSERDINFECVDAILSHITTLEMPGAVLIFLPGWNVIFTLMRHLKSHPKFGTLAYEVLPLHSQLPREDQRKVFLPPREGARKIILATNIAETSITINDVVFVIDSCRSKVKMFTSHNNMTNYATVWASRTNLEQRKGRAGRVRPGLCFHLCSRARFNKMEEHVVPEMFRTPLHEIALSIKLLRLGSIGEFLSKAIQAPPLDTVVEAEVLLREMKCLDVNDELTPLGRILARLPLEPRLGIMMIMGCIFNCGDAMATLAAHNATSPEIFIIPPEYKRLSPRQRGFAGNHSSDHIAMLNAFNTWDRIRHKGEEVEISFCEERGISLPTMRVTLDAKNQLKDLLVSAGFPEDTLLPQHYDFKNSDPNVDIIIALLTIGHYPNVCVHKEKRKVITPGSKSALVHKSSVNCFREVTFASPFFVFGEKIRTRAVSCKQMTMVAALHLLLFGSKKVEYVNDEKPVYIDDWITLAMSPAAASKVLCLRPVLEAILIRTTRDPESLSELGQFDSKVLGMMRDLSRFDAGRHNMEPAMTQIMGKRPEGFESNSGGYNNPNKRGRFCEPFRGSFRGGNGGPPRGGGYMGNRRGGGYRGGYRGGFQGGFRGGFSGPRY